MRKTLKTALCVSLSIAAAGVLAKEVINSSLNTFRATRQALV